MAYGSIGVGNSFPPGVYFVSCNCAPFSALIVAVVGRYRPDASTAPAAKTWRQGIRQGLRSCSCCTAILPADDPYARAVVLKGTFGVETACNDTRAACNVHHAVSSG